MGSTSGGYNEQTQSTPQFQYQGGGFQYGGGNYTGEPLWNAPQQQPISPLDWARLSYQLFPNSPSYPYGINPDYMVGEDIANLPRIHSYNLYNNIPEEYGRIGEFLGKEKAPYWMQYLQPDWQAQLQQNQGALQEALKAGTTEIVSPPYSVDPYGSTLTAPGQAGQANYQQLGNIVGQQNLPPYNPPPSPRYDEYSGALLNPQEVGTRYDPYFGYQIKDQHGNWINVQG